MARRNYNDIFHAQTSAYFAEHPEDEYTKVFYMIRKLVDNEEFVDDATGESMIVNQSVEIKSVEFVRGTGVQQDTIDMLDKLYREKNIAGSSTASRIPRFVYPDVYTERQIETLKKLGHVYND
jgi:hypothetical protein